MKLFVALVLAFLGLLWTYVGLGLIFPMLSETRLLWLGWGFLGGTFSLQLWRLAFFATAEKSPRLLLATYFSLGLMCYLMVATLIKGAVGLFFPITPVMLLGLLIISLLMNMQSLWIAKKGPRIRTVFLKTGLPGSALRIVQLSDLHIGPIITKKYVENVVRLVSELKPDLIVATGDMGDGTVSSLTDDLAPLETLREMAPCFYVTGNHEYYWGAEDWIQKMESLGFQPLLNRGLALDFPEKQSLWLGGIPDPQGGRFIPDHKVDAGRAIQSELAQNRYKVLLAHQPKSCHDALTAGFDLMLCGHTHGGQFFPFTMLVGFFNPYSRGLNNHHGMKVYVNVGTGFWGPPLRLGARAEITCLELS